MVEVLINIVLFSKILNCKNIKESLFELKSILENICYKKCLNKNLFKVEIILNIFKVEDVYLEVLVLVDYLI